MINPSKQKQHAHNMEFYGLRKTLLLLPEVSQDINSLAPKLGTRPESLLNLLLIEALEARAKKGNKPKRKPKEKANGGKQNDQS